MNTSTLSHFKRLLWCCATLASAATLLAAPPKVVKAVPDNQATGVDPDLRELRIEFDQPMSQGGWSVVGGGPTYPKMVGKARWVDERTFTWSWRLEPEHDYWFGINSPSFKNFRSESGEPAEPYPVGFTTGKRTGAAATNAAARQVALNREAVVHLKRSLDEDYSYRDLRETNWEERFAHFRPQLETNCSPRQFAQVAAELLSAAQDIHLWLQVNGETIPTWKRRAVWNVAANRLPRFVPRWQQRSSLVCTGQFGDGLRYLFIRAWPADAREELEPAYEALTDAAEASPGLSPAIRPATARPRAQDSLWPAALDRGPGLPANRTDVPRPAWSAAGAARPGRRASRPAKTPATTAAPAPPSLPARSVAESQPPATA